MTFKIIEDSYESLICIAYEVFINDFNSTLMVINPSKSYANFTRLSKITGVLAKDKPNLILKYFYIEKEIESIKKMFINNNRISKGVINLIVQESLLNSGTDLSFSTAKRYTSSFKLLTNTDLLIHTGPNLLTYMVSYEILQEKEAKLKSLNNKELNKYISELKDEYLMAKVEFCSIIDEEIRNEVLEEQESLVNYITEQNAKALLQSKTSLKTRNWIYNRLKDLGND